MTGLEWVNPGRTQKPALLVGSSNQCKLYRMEQKRKVKTESIKKIVSKGQGIRIPKTKVVEESTEGKLISTFKSGSERNVHSMSMA